MVGCAGGRLAVLAKLLALMTAVALLAPATLATVGTAPAALSPARSHVVAISTGSAFYVFGGLAEASGSTSSVDTILRYDPVTGSQVLAATLPAQTYGSCAVWTGQYAYLFGGQVYNPNQHVVSSDVVRFNPVTETIAIVAQLPEGRAACAAAWDGTFAYIIGGVGPDSGDYRSDILRFDPANATVTPMTTELDTGRVAAAAARVGPAIYVFGGATPVGLTATVGKFSPSAGTFEVLPSPMPAARNGLTAAMVGGRVFLFGGGSPEILAFEPHSGLTRVHEDSLPASPYFSASAATGSAPVYLFGGDAGGPLAQVFMFAIDASRVETQQYLPWIGVYPVLACDVGGSGIGVGMACFTLAGVEKDVHVFVTDVAAEGLGSSSVAGFYLFRDGPLGANLGMGFFCGSTTGTFLPVPSGALWLSISVDAYAATADSHCSDGALGTEGTITAMFGYFT